MLIKFNNKYYVLIQLSCYLFTLFTAGISKQIIARARPIIEVSATIDKYSFPSGHTIMSFVCYYFIAYILSIKSDKYTKFAYYIIATVLVFTVAFSRLYLGVHYFSDIIGSVLFGTIILLMMRNIVEKNFKGKLV